MGLIHHQVNTYIEDNEFDMVSQEILLNGSFDKWSDRVHSAYEGKPPAIIQPKMESFLKRPVKTVMICGRSSSGVTSSYQEKKASCFTRSSLND